MEIRDEEAEITPRAQAFAESEQSTEVDEGSSLQRRKRQRDEGPSRPAEATLPQPSGAPRPILGEFSEQDSAVDSATARRLNKLMVLPLDRQRFKAPSWEDLGDA